MYIYTLIYSYIHTQHNITCHSIAWQNRTYNAQPTFAFLIMFGRFIASSCSQWVQPSGIPIYSNDAPVVPLPRPAARNWRWLETQRCSGCSPSHSGLVSIPEDESVNTCKQKGSLYRINLFIIVNLQLHIWCVVSNCDTLFFLKDRRWQQWTSGQRHPEMPWFPLWFWLDWTLRRTASAKCVWSALLPGIDYYSDLQQLD